MTEPIYADDWLTVFQGDAREVLATLPEKSVHMCMTSPPYFGLRDYGTAIWEGGDPDCDHHRDTAHQKQGATSQRVGRQNVDEQRNETFRNACAKCGAIRTDAQIGREPTPSEYVEALVETFREVWRVLRDDGTLWLNLGDSYAAQRGGTAMPAETISGGEHGLGPEEAKRGRGNGYQPHRNASKIGYKHKDLMLVPSRVAMAMQADGWYLRNDIVWATPNPMPESVTDRFTNSYEHVFLFSKLPRYFFDQDAVREPHTEVTLNRIKYGLKHKHPDGIGVAIPPVDVDEMGERFAHAGGRNRRDVWTIPTVSYSGAHYAVFPPALVEPCVKAGTSERGVCIVCGAPWARATEKNGELDMSRPQARRAMELAEAADLTPAHIAAIRAVGTTDVGKGRLTQTGAGNNAPEVQALADEAKAALGGYYREFTFAVSVTTGWEPTCEHVAATVPATVLDCFAGSGTVGKVAQSLSRRAVLIDLNTEYLEQQMTRNSQVPLGLVFESLG